MTGNNYGTVVLPCSCKHPQQDKIYGKGMRLHNRCSINKASMTGARCTVCTSVKSYSTK